MKICPVCNEKYTDDSLNFCLNDGNTLNFAKDDPPPTIFMNQPRATNPNWTGYQPPTYENQQITQQQSRGIYNPNFTPIQRQDQTLATISLILGLLSILLLCCYGGIPLGLAAAITGFIGMNNANNNPIQYGGKGLAIAGMICGIAGVLGTVLFIFLAIIAK